MIQLENPIRWQVGRENTLLYVDIPEDTAEASGQVRSQLTWNSLIESTFQPSGLFAAKVSKEEQLLLERKRLSWVSETKNTSILKLIRWSKLCVYANEMMG